MSIDTIENVQPMGLEARWGSLTLSSLVKAATSYNRLFEGDEKEVADVFNEQVERAHDWLFTADEPPVLELFRLVKVSDSLKTYLQSGDESYLQVAKTALTTAE